MIGAGMNELLIVMSIIAVLMTVVALSLTEFLGTGKSRVCQFGQCSIQPAALLIPTPIH